MGVYNACGDSRAYFRAHVGEDAHLYPVRVAETVKIESPPEVIANRERVRRNLTGKAK